MATTRQTLKDYFKKYATPTEAQFAALIDSFVHKDEDSLTQEKIDGLTAALNDKVSSSELQSAVEAAVAETLQGGNLEVTPAAHEHAVSDISGLGARLTTLETSKADYEAFKTLVTAFLNDADVSDTTINRWKELEDFLNGITDSDTLAGMLQALKAEILAEVPQPQTGNYLEQVTDMAAALQTAEVGKIVQYVGQSDAEYTRGLCYEKKEDVNTVETLNYYVSGISPDITSSGYPRDTEVDIWDVFKHISYKAHKTDLVVTLIGNDTAAIFEGAQPGTVGWRNNGDVWVVVQTEDLGDSIKVWFGQSENTGLSYCWQNTIPKTTFTLPVWQENDSGRYFVLFKTLNAIVLDDDLKSEFAVLFADTNRPDFTYTTETETVPSWQPIVTSPTVS